MKEIENLYNKQQEIEKLIESDWNHCGEKLEEPVYDGVLNVEAYSKSGQIKLLWILQEPYGDGDWHFRDLIEKFIKERSFEKTWRTWEMIMYVSWAIYNSHKDDSGVIRLIRWDDIPNYKSTPEMMTALRNIAFINVKKHPNTKGTNAITSSIKDAYNGNKEILLKQVSFCEPDIIIGGNTLRYFYPDLGIANEQIIKPENKSIYYSVYMNSNTGKKTLLIDAYHPAYREFNREEKRKQYCDDILETTENWLNNIM